MKGCNADSGGSVQYKSQIWAHGADQKQKASEAAQAHGKDKRLKIEEPAPFYSAEEY